MNDRMPMEDTIPGPDLRHDRRIGTTLGGAYSLKRILFRGVLGTLYVATRVRDQSEVVVKVLEVGKANPEFRDMFLERFRREAMGLAELSHPNIVDILACDLYDDQTPYIVMEYLDGVTLKAFVEQFPKGMPYAGFFELMRQICSAVQFIHEKGIVHRDLKPHNIMVAIHDGEIKLKLLDFGLVYFDRNLDLEHLKQITQKGDLVGTPVYMAPEQCRGKRVTFHTDIYNLGLISYELLTGAPPFLSETLPSLIRKQTQERPRPLSASRPDISPQLEKAVLQALEKEPVLRFHSSHDFWVAMEKARRLSDSRGEA